MTSNDFNKYGVPAQKKFPMPDADHVRSAIKFFNYVSPQYEKILARAILQRAKEYGVDLSEMSIGDENRFKKYLPEGGGELKHFGIPGMKWGVRRFQNKDGTLTSEGRKRRALSDKEFEKKERKASKLEKRINEESKYAYLHEQAALKREEEARKYKEESSKYKAKNAVYKLGRAYTQAYLNKQAKDMRDMANWGQKRVNRLIKKINKDEYLDNKVYLGDIYKYYTGIPYDLYAVSANRDVREKKK